MIRPIFLLLVSMFLAAGAALSGVAHAAINYNKPWAKVARDANGNMIYVRDLGQPSSGMYKVGISGVNGYNNISQGANGVLLKRSLPLVNESGIIRGTEVGLKKVAQGVGWDTITATPPAVAKAGRIFFKRALPVVGAAITAYELYQAFADDDIYYDPNSGGLLKDHQDIVPPLSGPHVIQVYNNAPGRPFNSCFDGQIVSSVEECAIDYFDPRQGCNAFGYSIHYQPRRPAYVSVPSSSGVFWASWSYLGERSDWPQGCTGGVVVSEAPVVTNVINFRFIDEIPVCPDGYFFRNDLGHCVKDYSLPATDDEIDAAIENQPITDFPQYVQEIADRGDGSIDLPTNSPASLDFDQPSYSTSPTVTTSTVTNPDGSTTTRRTEETQRVTPTLDGETLADQTLTVNVTNITNVYNNDQLVEHSEEDNPAPPLPDEDPTPDTPPIEVDTDPCKDGACDFSDPGMPPQPTLYEQKYPDGIVGVWAQKWPQLQATAFVQSIAKMFPDFSDGGSCPNWGLDMNIASWANYGYQTFGVSCAIWQVVGLIFVTSACFAAWRIIF